MRILEFSGLGPGPHCVMLLSDLGAEVLRIDRPGGNGWPNPVVDRGRHTLEIDIRTEEGRARVLELIEHVDVLVEGNRPGVMERLGLGPEPMLALNPRLIYGRMTGWGQTGPLAKTAGHDINYIALTGALAAITDDKGQPVPPLNLVGDFGGGSLYLALGIVAALYERTLSGRGQVIDAAIVDGTTSLMAMFGGLVTSGRISLERDRNLLSGTAHFYRCYECSDGKHVSIGAIEPQFYAQLLDRIGAPDHLRDGQNEPAGWAEHGDTLAALFREKTRDQWCEILEGTDVCFAPVLTFEEAPSHPHMETRAVYVDVDGVNHPAPAPRLSRTPCDISPGGDGEELRQRWLEEKR